MKPIYSAQGINEAILDKYKEAARRYENKYGIDGLNKLFDDTSTKFEELRKHIEEEGYENPEFVNIPLIISDKPPEGAVGYYNDLLRLYSLEGKKETLTAYKFVLEGKSDRKLKNQIEKIRGLAKDAIYDKKIRDVLDPKSYSMNEIEVLLKNLKPDIIEKRFKEVESKLTIDNAEDIGKETWRMFKQEAKIKYSSRDIPKEVVLGEMIEAGLKRKRINVTLENEKTSDRVPLDDDLKKKLFLIQGLYSSYASSIGLVAGNKK